MPEEEAFCVLVRLMVKYKLRELYKPSMADLGLCFYQLDKLIEVITTKNHLSYVSSVNVLIVLIAGVIPISLHAL